MDSLGALLQGLAESAGAVLVAEEAVVDADLNALSRWLAAGAGDTGLAEATGGIAGATATSKVTTAAGGAKDIAAAS